MSASAGNEEIHRRARGWCSVGSRIKKIIKNKAFVLSGRVGSLLYIGDPDVMDFATTRSRRAMSQDEPAQEAPTASRSSTIAAVAIPLPLYWDHNPVIWFLQADSQFYLAGITSQQRKYHYIV